MKDIRKFMFPPERVLVSSDKYTSFEILKDSDFKRVLTDDEIEDLVYADKGKNIFNGRCVRLDRVEEGVCYLSIVVYYFVVQWTVLLEIWWIV